MPASNLELVPGPNSLLEMQMLGTSISAIAYGIVIILSLDCFRLLFRQKAPVQYRPMRRFLSVFISVMFLLSTLSLVQAIFATSMSIFHGPRLPSLLGAAPFSLPFTIWGADAFMLWRCVVLYQGISRLSRLGLFCLMILIFLASLGSGILLFLKMLSGRLPTLLMVSISTFLTLIVTSLIAARLAYHQAYLRKVLGPGHGSPYKRINAVIVESATLIVLTCVPYLFLVAFENPASAVLLILLPHVCVISPLLIIYRVAQGRAAAEMPSGVDSGGRAIALVSRPIRFNTGNTSSLLLSSADAVGGSSAETKKAGLPVV